MEKCKVPHKMTSGSSYACEALLMRHLCGNNE